MGKSTKQKKAEELSLKQQQASLDAFNKAFGLQLKQYESIKPFATMLLNFGIDPVSFLKSPQGQALLRPQQEATAANFEQSRQNLVDLLGATGFSTQSGIGAAPFANLLSDEASQQSANIANLIGQSLGLGLQGANVLQGQQAVFNPTPFGQVGNQAGQNVIYAPNPFNNLLQAGIGAGGAALGGLLQNPKFKLPGFLGG